jgi:hypothetical protein
VRDAFLAAINDLGYIVAAYAVTAVVLGGYVAYLLARARRARLRAEAVAARRDRGPTSRASAPNPAAGP